ncbi:hypothetical protein [Citrobacter sp. NCU1]|uniref:hypothetical protein n=1 Tax=Citrobacter sp. NCU1 TaxID=2026683 RepID=UPI00139187E9|nr:hypothetical protein [Citrobacter sp. NCU1]
MIDCTRGYTARYDDTKEQERHLKLDKSECKSYTSSNSGYVQIDHNGNQGGFANGWNTGMALAAAANKSDLYDICMNKRGWTTDEDEFLQQKDEIAKAKLAAKKDVSDFMAAHPEYKDTARHDRLSIEVFSLMNDPMNKGLTLSQLLILADERIKTLKAP